MFQKFFVTMALRVSHILSLWFRYLAEYVHKTNNKIWNLIQKRSACVVQGSSQQTEPNDFNRREGFGGCKNIYSSENLWGAYTPSWKRRGIRAWTQHFLSITKIMIMWVAGRRAIIMNQHWWKKTDEYDLLQVLWNESKGLGAWLIDAIIWNVLERAQSGSAH